MKKIMILIILSTLLVAQSVLAKSTQDVCGITNVKACFTSILSGFFNASLSPFIDLIKTLLTATGGQEPFRKLWVAIVYACSFSSLLLLSMNGIKLIIYADDAVKRYEAKKNFQNILLIVVLLPSSFVIYDTLTSFNTSLTTSMLSSIDTSFFQIHFDGILNSILNTILFLLYVFVVLMTVIFLVARYVIISVGGVLFPIGIFFQYASLLKSYGSLVINFLLTNIFSGFIASIIINILSVLSGQNIFQNYHIIYAIASLLITDAVLLACMLFVILKASFEGVQTVSRIGLFL